METVCSDLKASNVKTSFLSEMEVKPIDCHFSDAVKDVEKMIVDSGAPKSQVGEKWLENYLRWNNLKKEELEIEEVDLAFTYGNPKVYPVKENVLLPL